MSIIQLLPTHIANQIAAGEVIQRPSSAAKEMLENALDAGADNIKLIIRDGGKSLIQVIDNGCGMSQEDLKICYKRHSTSKIKNIEDLSSIKTMGFRGEAMASISSISQLEIITKLTEEEIGHKIRIENGETKDVSSCVCANGTSIKVKNLFFNVPARRKFLKSDKIETKHIIEEFHRISLSHPDISFSLSIDKKEVYMIEKSNLRQRIVSIIGNKNNELLVPINEETDLIKIHGFIGKPEFSKRTRGEQYFFVNGRFIKNHYLNHAIKKAYEDLIADTHHPSYFIYLETDPSKIDVNIHPTKTEIKFQDEKAIYSILRSCVKKSIGQYNIAPTLNFDTEQAFDLKIDKKETFIKEPKIKLSKHYNPFENNKNSLFIDPKMDIEDNHQTKIDGSNFDDVTLKCFQIKRKYIVCESKDGIIIINQQRAHQRILYEEFKNKESKIDKSQKLIFAQEINMSKQHINEIIEIKEELNSIGFEFEVINNKIKCTSVPTSCLRDDLTDLFEEILQDNEIIRTDLKEKLNSQISKSLCKSLCVKSGEKLNNKQIQEIVSKLMKCDIPSVSPFGSVTYFNINEEDVIKKFN